MIMQLRGQYCCYLDNKKGILTLVGYFNDEPYLIEIKANKIYKILAVTKEAGETLKDIAKKKPAKELMFDSSSEEL